MILNTSNISFYLSIKNKNLSKKMIIILKSLIIIINDDGTG